MFTGIVQEVGRVSQATHQHGSMRLTIHAPKSASELSINDSVAIQGVCQTVIAKRFDEFTVEAVEETLKKTTLGSLSSHAHVNLELPMRLNDRLGGHLVLGHVDGVGSVTSVEEQETSSLFNIEIPAVYRKYVIPVGSIAVDGVSLTIARLTGKTITVSIIPHTFENTTFNHLTVGAHVNLEFDIVGKYIERIVSLNNEIKGEGGITKDRLKQWGFDE